MFFSALLKKDLRLLLADRRGLLINLAAPLVLAPFIGYLFAPKDTPASRIDLAVVDMDRSVKSASLIEKLASDDSLEVRTATASQARADIEEGDLTAAVILPAGLGDHLNITGLFTDERPRIELLVDPSREIEGEVIEGLLARYTMEILGTGFQDRDVGIEQFELGLAHVDEIDATDEERSRWREFFQAGVKALETEGVGWGDGASGPEVDDGEVETGGGFTLPIEIATEEVVRSGHDYNSYAHTFAGMLVMFLLFGSIETGGGLLEEQRRGTWRRLQLAPGRRSWALASKAAALFCSSALTTVVLFAFGIAFFGIRVHGSVAGFILVALTYCLCVAAFSLMLAGLGRSEAQIRGIATFAILLMSFAGGAWFPIWFMPSWLVTAARAIPTSWAMRGLENMTWRGLGLSAALPDAAALLGFTILFAFVGVKTFRWDR